MGKRMIVVVVAILIIGAAAFGLTRNDKSGSSNQNNPASTNQTSQNNQNSKQAPTGTDSVSIQNFAFLPGDISFKKGTTVTWTNNDSTTHSVNETDGKKGPDSGNLSSGDTYSFTFNEVGTFKYRCNIHPDMLGTVTVTD